MSLKDFKYIEYVQTLVLSGNPLTCNDDLKELVKLLTENGVASSDGTEKKQSEEINIKGSVDIFPVKYDLGWAAFMNHICETKQNLTAHTPSPNESSKTVTDAKPNPNDPSKTVTDAEPNPNESSKRVTDAKPNPNESSKSVITPEHNSDEYSKTVTGSEPISDESSKTVTEFEPTSDESIKNVINLEPLTDDTEMVPDNEKTVFTMTPDSEHVIRDFPEDIHKDPVKRAKTNYMWFIIIGSVITGVIILIVIALAGFLLQWNRQRNGYRNKIARRHSISRTPRPKHGSTIYQQLYEDPNTPTTPIMLSRVPERPSEEQTFSFPDRETSATSTTPVQPLNRVSYLSSPFHHSNIVPDCV
jgi:hypothetical protein